MATLLSTAPRCRRGPAGSRAAAARRPTSPGAPRHAWRFPPGTMEILSPARPQGKAARRRASGAPRRGEARRMAQHLGAGAETLERLERRADEALAFGPRGLDAEHVDERRLAFLGILAGALADGLGTRPAVEEVVGDLEG